MVTAKVLAFAKCGEEIAIATVPLHEITRIYNVSKEASEEDGEDGQPLDISRTETFSRKGERVSDVKVFEIRTEELGMNGGKRFRFRANTTDEAHRLVDKLKGMIYTAIETHARLTKYEKSKQAVRKLFWSTPFQLFVAMLIFANFLFNIAQNQPVPEEGGATEKMFENVDLAFTIVFTIELVINAYGNWAAPFFSNGWSMFDLLVVSVSLLALFLSNLPGFSILRLMRVFRVVRLFGRLKSLKKIVNAIIRSIIPVLNSFVILFLCTCIYALIGVSFFSERAPQIFGTFAQAIIVLFQLTAGNAWIGELPAYNDDGHLDPGVVTYLVSYIVIVNWTLLQVTVAVLLDNFVSATAQSEEEDRMQELEDNPVRIVAHSLDPLLAVLVNTYDTREDLTMRIHGLFDIMDEDESGTLTEQELLIGLRGLPVEPHLHILSDDLDQILEKSHVHREGIAKDEFTLMMFGQCLEYAQRRMTDVIKLNSHNEQVVAEMCALKLALTMLREFKERHRRNDSKFAKMQADVAKQGRNIEAIMAHMGIAPTTIDDEPWSTSGPAGQRLINGGSIRRRASGVSAKALSGVSGLSGESIGPGSLEQVQSHQPPGQTFGAHDPDPPPLAFDPDSLHAPRAPIHRDKEPGLQIPVPGVRGMNEAAVVKAAEHIDVGTGVSEGVSGQQQAQRAVDVKRATHAELLPKPLALLIPPPQTLTLQPTSPDSMPNRQRNGNGTDLPITRAMPPPPLLNPDSAAGSGAGFGQPPSSPPNRHGTAGGGSGRGGGAEANLVYASPRGSKQPAPPEPPGSKDAAGKPFWGALWT